MDPSQPASQQNKPDPKEVQKVSRFLASIPPSSDSSATSVTFDSKRDATESDLCRKLSGGGKDCLKVFMSSTALFGLVQKSGYFCQAPLDPGATEIQCTRITDGPLAPELDVGRSSNPTAPIAP